MDERITTSAPRFANVALAVAYAAMWAVFLAGELLTAAEPTSPAGLFERLIAAEPDTLVYLALLIAAPFAWWRRGTESSGHSGRQDRLWNGFWSRAAQGERGPAMRGWVWSLVIACTSLGASAWVGRAFDRLPPAYHDEFSYLFQAETFLGGRVSYPSHELARLFDQMHIFNEGRYASRYFPGTGLWMAPWVALGDAWWGHWLAGAICAVLMFWTGRELAGEACGAIAGLLTALSPGMALFSNLLLAHHPTLVGLALFVLAYLKCLRLRSPAWAAVAGVGMAFAALCRPMTAFGVALPFGIDFLLWLMRGARANGENPAPAALSAIGKRLTLAAAMAAPLFCAAGAMFFYDREITGSGWVTPYGLYTDIYTPRHVYGFNNGVRGDSKQGPRVIVGYDRWAENLTWPLARKNVTLRWVASWRWTVGVIPLCGALVCGLILWQALPVGTRLILAGIVSLHAAHIPYWFVGMEDHHYVFEAGPLWCLWLGAVTLCAARGWLAERRSWMTLWWSVTLVTAVVLNYSPWGGTWSAPLHSATVNVRFARNKHAQFEALVEREVQSRPALVLIEADPANVHIDYVTNHPALDSSVLLGRYIPETVSLTEVERLFPDRSLYLYRERENRLVRVK